MTIVLNFYLVEWPFPVFRKIANILLKRPTKGKSKKLIEYYLTNITQAKWVGLEQGQGLLHNEWI